VGVCACLTDQEQESRKKHMFSWSQKLLTQQWQLLRSAGFRFNHCGAAEMTGKGD
jgi:hypothetical protein